MSSQVFLPVSDVVIVNVQGTPVNLQQLNINTCALISSETPLNASIVGSYAIYQGATQVGLDWGTSSKAFAIATAFFAQNPNPIGSQGYLVIIPRIVGTAALLVEQDITFTAVAPGTGGNSITVTYTSGAVAGQEVVTVVSNAITVQIANGVSTAQQVLTAINGSVAATALVFAYISGASGNAQSTVSSTPLAGGSGTGLESIQGAIIRTANIIFYYGILCDVDMHATASVFSALTTFIQTLQKIFFYAASEQADVLSGGILQLATAAAKSRTRCMYYNDSVQNDTYAFAAAYASRALSTNYNAPGSVQTMNLKTLAGVTPDQTITETFKANALGNGVEIYPAIGNPNNGYLLISGANQFFDVVYGEDWFSFAVQTALFNILATTGSKIAQTETGMSQLKAGILNVCAQAVVNGFVAAGSWTAATPFGNPADFVRCIADTGYYVYSQPIASQSPAQRVTRVAPTIQVGLKLAGAVQSIVCNVFVNA